MFLSLSVNESSSSGNDIVKLEVPEDFSGSEEIEEIEFDESYSEPSTTSLSGQDVITTSQIATFDSSESDRKKTAGWLTTNHITGEKSRVLLIPILYKKRYAKIFDEKGKGCLVSDQLNCIQVVLYYAGCITVRMLFKFNASPGKDIREKLNEK